MTFVVGVVVLVCGWFVVVFIFVSCYMFASLRYSSLPGENIQISETLFFKFDN
jgi:hypothetical protein